MDDVYPNGGITNWDRKWPTVTLRCYGLDSQVSKYFPKTMQLVNSSPTWLSHVMYSILEPQKFIPRHRGPYRGVFRYQLALEVPPTNNIENLYLAVWPNTSSHQFWSPEHIPPSEPTLVQWEVGKDFIFDDTCVHEVRNNTIFRRIILFMDAERHDVPFYSRLVHKLFMNLARFLPAVRQAIDTQDKFLKTKTKIDKSHEITNNKDNDVIDDNVNDDDTKTKNNDACGKSTSCSFNSHNWLLLNASRMPDYLPYKSARKLIEKNNARLKNKSK